MARPRTRIDEGDAGTDAFSAALREAERALSGAAGIARDAGVRIRSRAVRRSLNAALGLPASGAGADLFAIAAFALFAALLVHLGEATAPPFTSRGRTPWRGFLGAAWRKLGILPLAAAVLDDLPDDAASEALLAHLARAAQATFASGALARRDFLGRLYRRLLLAAAGPHYATYYTSVPAARLLADLTLGAPHPAGRFAAPGVAVLDPACGSGTLLAAAHAARPGARLAGWDVMAFAAEVARATLALNGAAHPDIRVLPVGAAKGRVRLGSLDHLRVGAAPQRHDVVLMNPPFSRSAKPNRTFGYSAAALRRRMQQELGALARAHGLAGVGRAGLGPYFLLLALALAADGGRIGLVVPRSMLSGVSWQKIRARYLDVCEVKFIVGNFDPGAPGIEPWNWSEKTAIGEVLVIAERTEKPAPRRGTVFVNVFRKPQSDDEAGLLAADVIAKAASLDNGGAAGLADGTGAVFRVNHDVLRRNWLAPAVFAEPALNRLALAVTGAPGLVPFAGLCAAIGPDIAQVKRAFAPSGRATDFPLVLGHQGDMATIAVSRHKLAYGAAKAANARALHRRFAARLLIAERPHLSTEALLAMRAPRKVLATAFWEIRPRETRWEALILLWLNSTYGALAFLAHATSSMGDIVKMKKDQLALMPLPDPARIDLGACATLLASLARTPFLPFAAEFARAAGDAGPRLALDQFFRAALGLPPLDAALYRMLARDPVVTRRRCADIYL